MAFESEVDAAKVQQERAVQSRDEGARVSPLPYPREIPGPPSLPVLAFAVIAFVVFAIKKRLCAGNVLGQLCGCSTIDQIREAR